MAGHSEDADQRLKSINREWVDALVGGDTATLGRLMDERCLFTDALAGDDKAQFLADIDSGVLKVNSLNRDNVEVCVYGSTGVLTALDEADWQYKDRHLQGHYRTLHVYAEKEGQWQIVAIQASPISMK